MKRFNLVAAFAVLAISLGGGTSAAALQKAGPDTTLKSLGKVQTSLPSTTAAQRAVCDAARDARARNAPFAPQLEAQCRVETARAGARPTAAGRASSLAERGIIIVGGKPKL